MSHMFAMILNEFKLLKCD